MVTWHKYAARRIDSRAKTESVKMTLYKLLEGDTWGIMTVTFQDWRHLVETNKIESRVLSRGMMMQAPAPVAAAPPPQANGLDSVHYPDLEIATLQAKMQELQIKRSGLENHPAEEREVLTVILRIELAELEKDMSKLRRLIHERAEALKKNGRDLAALEEEAKMMSRDLNGTRDLPQPRTLAEKIQAVLRDWHDHNGHLQALVRSLFADVDADHDGKIEWNNNEIRNFVHELFRRMGISFPPWQEHVFYQMYRQADLHGLHSLDMAEASNFARMCFEEALSLEVNGPKNPNDLIGGYEAWRRHVALHHPVDYELAATVNRSPKAASSSFSAPRELVASSAAAQRSAMTYSSGVVVDFHEYARLYQPIIAASVPHRSRMIQVIEGGDHLKTTMRTYRECDKDGNGRLHWSNGEVRNFIEACFRQHGLLPPNEEQMFYMYSKFDKDKSFYLDMRECLEMVDALFRSTFPTEPAPLPVTTNAAYIAREVSPVFGSGSQSVPAAMGSIARIRTASPTQAVQSLPTSTVVAMPIGTPGRLPSARSGSPQLHHASSAKELPTVPVATSLGSSQSLPPALFETIDTNHDGMISRTEFDRALNAGIVNEMQLRRKDGSLPPTGYPTSTRTRSPQPPVIRQGQRSMSPVPRIAIGTSAVRTSSPYGGAIVLEGGSQIGQPVSPTQSQNGSYVGAVMPGPPRELAAVGTVTMDHTSFQQATLQASLAGDGWMQLDSSPSSSFSAPVANAGQRTAGRTLASLATPVLSRTAQPVKKLPSRVIQRVDPFKNGTH
jgi:Ca2+-binding EF-hand superfamily protein